jgi:hypothetical protein
MNAGNSLENFSISELPVIIGREPATTGNRAIDISITIEQ